MGGVSGFDSSISGAGKGPQSVQSFEFASSSTPLLQESSKDVMSISSTTQELESISTLPPPALNSSITIAEFAKTVQLAINRLKDSRYLALLAKLLIDKGISGSTGLKLGELTTDSSDSSEGEGNSPSVDSSEGEGNSPSVDEGDDDGSLMDPSLTDELYYELVNSVLKQYMGVTKLSTRQIRQLLQKLSQKPNLPGLQLDTIADFSSIGILGQSKMVETLVNKMVFKHALSTVNRINAETESVVKLLIGEDTLASSLNPEISASSGKTSVIAPLLEGLFKPSLSGMGLSSDFIEQLFDLFRSALLTQSLTSVGPAAGFAASTQGSSANSSTMQIALAFGFLEAALALIQPDDSGVLQLANSFSEDLSQLSLTEEQTGAINKLLSQGVSLAEALGQVLPAAGSEVFNTLVTFLHAHPEIAALPANTQGQVVQSISDMLILHLGLISLVQASKALESPGLSAQILSLLPGIQSLESNVLSPPVFKDFAPLIASSSFATSLLLGAGLDASEAGSTLVEALNRFETLSSTEKTAENFIDVFTKALKKAGLEESKALAVANSLASAILSALEQKLFTQSELNTPLLMEAFTKDLLAKAADSTSLAESVLNDLLKKNQIKDSLLQSSILEDFRLNDEITRSAIQSNLLAANVIKENILRDEITQSIIRQDITLRQIRDSLRQELESLGYTLTDAANKAQDIIDRLREDFVLQQRLELALSEQSSIRFSLQQSLIRQGISQDRAIESARLAFEEAKIAQNALSSQESFKDALAASLVSQGILNSASSQQVVSQIDFGKTSSQVLQNFTVTSGVSREELEGFIKELVLESTIEQLGEEKANLLASNLASALLDEHKGLLAVLDAAIKRVEQRDEERSTGLLSDIIRFVTRPNRELYAFIEQLKDPANSLIYSAATGIMYVDTQPDNYKKSIDIIV